jgi:hypothetical protein
MEFYRVIAYTRLSFTGGLVKLKVIPRVGAGVNIDWCIINYSVYQ